MATMLLVASYFNVSGPGDMSSALSKVELTVEVEEKDVTTFGSLGWKTVTGGLKSGTISTTFFDDYTDDALNEDLWTIWVAGVPVSFAARWTNAEVSASNPNYSGTALLKGVPLINGTVGDIAGGDLSWTLSGALLRSTS